MIFKKKKPICLNCKHFAQYGGGHSGYKYACNGKGFANLVTFYFEKPPKYCAYFVDVKEAEE